MKEKACEGGRVLEAWHDMAECIECGTCVRWDLRDDPFFGFHSCSEKARNADAVAEVRGDTPSARHLDPHTRNAPSAVLRALSVACFSAARTRLRRLGVDIQFLMRYCIRQ